MEKVNYPKTEKIEIRLRQDLADRLPKDKKEKNAYICRAVEYAIDRPFCQILLNNFKTLNFLLSIMD